MAAFKELCKMHKSIEDTTRNTNSNGIAKFICKNYYIGNGTILLRDQARVRIEASYTSVFTQSRANH